PEIYQMLTQRTMGRFLHSRVYINATSTRHQKNRTSTHKRAVVCSGGQLAVARDSGSRHHPPVVL
ncbi:hypothetical protein, partial [Phaeovulum veldkampii]|uniref:hypothetical protein n=1 Tax=Phaeovulum veldkampii TaxID=33049 RepID=UPI001AECD582